MPTPELLDDARALLNARPDESGATRRTALKAALGVGYAAAALPIAAQTAVRTPADGLRTGQISYEVAGFKVPAYFAAPQGRTDLPVVLVIQEIFGVHEYIADVARRFAREGYLAIAPELFARQGDPRGYTDIPKLQAEIVSKVPDAQVMADLDGVVQWAAGNGGDARKVSINGFCWGGRIVWLYAQHRPLHAGVAWYGRLLGQASATTPRHPLDGASELKAPVLGLYGSADTGIPVATVEQMKQALAQAAGQGNRAAAQTQFVVYPDAPHAFHADYRATYRQQAAEDGFKRALAWLRSPGSA
jgi:carboxymethylenebutenolidase